VTRPLPTSQLSDDEPEEPRWLWENRIALESVTLVQGDGAVGKSTIMRWLAARVSRGELEGALRGEPACVLWFNVEEHVARDIRRGVDRQGGDPALIYTWRPTRSLRIVRFPQHLDRLRDAVVQRRARLVVLDQVSAFLPPNDGGIRESMLGFREIAETCGCAIVITRNLNGRKGADTYRRGRGGSLLVDIVRAAFHVALHPDGQGSRVLAPFKPNDPAASTHSVIFTASESGRLEIDQELELDPEELLALQRSRFADRETKLEEAVAFVREFLTGREVATNELNDAAAQRWFSLRTVERARAALGARHRRVWQRQPDGSTVHMTLVRLPSLALPDGTGDPDGPMPPGSPIHDDSIPTGSEREPDSPAQDEHRDPPRSVPQIDVASPQGGDAADPQRGGVGATSGSALDDAAERFRLLELDGVPDVGGAGNSPGSNGVRTPPTKSANENAAR